MNKAAKVTASVKSVSPVLAELWLTKNTSNRPLSKRRAKSLADVIDRGEWMLNGETVKFADDGTLIDGQHRLQAICLAGRAVDIVVVEGLPRSAFKTIDEGKVRTPGDCMHILGYKYHTAIATAARYTRMLELGWSDSVGGHRRISNDEMLGVLERYPDLPDIVGEAMRKPIANHLVPQSGLGFTYFVASKVHREKARQFYSQFASGEYTSNAQSHPPRVLREILLQRDAEVLRPSPRDKRAWVIEAWNAWLARKPLARPSRVVQAVPAFEPNPIARHR